ASDQPDQNGALPSRERPAPISGASLPPSGRRRPNPDPIRSRQCGGSPGDQNGAAHHPGRTKFAASFACHRGTLRGTQSDQNHLSRIPTASALRHSGGVLRRKADILRPPMSGVLDAVCLSAGGCVAYYPTKVPFHHRSAWLGERDVFGELLADCRKLGMVVIARPDPPATYDDAQAAHPDWIAVDASGRPRRHWASPEMWVTCGVGPYNFEFMTEVKQEIMSRYRPDAIFINRWDGSGMCYCEHCRKNFRAASGHDELPRTNDPQDPARRAYILWRQQRLFDLWRLWDAEVRKINPD